MHRENKLFTPTLTLYNPSALSDNYDASNPFSTAELMIKPLRSTKNQFQIKRDFFRSRKLSGDLHRKYSFTRDQLQKQKQQLIESIHILKNSAISAIAEKDDNLQRLREGSLLQNKQQLELYEQVLTKSICTQKQLINDNQQLYSQLHQQRAEMIDILQEKQSKIQELTEAMNSLRNYVYQLQCNQKKLLSEIKNMSQQVAYLTKILQYYNVEAATEENEKTVDLDQTKPPLTSSIASNLHLNKSNSNLLDALQISDLSVSIEKQYNDMIQQLMVKHQKDMNEITQFYQNKIASIRDIYNNYIDDQLKNPNSQSKQRRAISRFQSLIDCTSYKTNSRYQGKVDFQRQNPIQPIERCINRSKSSQQHWLLEDPLTQFQIIERVSQPSVHNLKDQLNFIPECLSPRRQEINHKSSSQFTKKHLQNPLLFHKQKSADSFNNLHNGQSIQTACNKSNHAYSKSEGKSQKKIKNPQQKQHIFWQKACAFATGLISGISLTSLLALALKKKKIANMLLR